MSERLLFDANVLIALSFTDHIHHRLVTDWFGGDSRMFATCPSTQGSLARFTLRQIPNGAETVKDLLSSLESMPNHEFWPDSIHYSGLSWRRIVGHRQVTDAYLVALAQHRGGRLATLDRALATVYPDALLIGNESNEPKE